MNKGYYNRLLEAKEKYGNRVVADDGQEQLTYSDLLDAAVGYGKLLREMGVAPGENVTLCSYNSCGWLKAFFGVICYGAVAVLMNYSLPFNDISDLRWQMKSEVLLYGNFSALEKDPAVIDRLQKDPAKRLDIRAVRFAPVTDHAPVVCTEEDLLRPAFAVFTSGSTGNPKGALLSQKSNITGSDAYMEALPEMREETLCMGVPLFHIFGLGIAVSHLLYGGKLLLPEKFTNPLLLSFIETGRPDAITAVMTVIVRLMEDPAFPKNGYDFVKRVYTGGAPLLPIQVMRVENGFGHAVLLNSYGQTESDTAIAMTTSRDPFEKRVHSVGRPLPHRKITIMNGDGLPCKTGEVGEVTLKDDGCVMRGYFNVSRELQAIDENGYLHTADLGFLDEDGYLHLSGRIKDIIIKGGENIIPSRIEAVINELPEVREVKVMGAADDLYGENVEACLTLKPGVSVTEAELREKLTGKIARFSMPVNFLIFDAFPLKANGKLDVCRLHTLMLERLNERKVAADLQNGIEIFTLRVRCHEKAIGPMVYLSQLLPPMGFSELKNKKIKLCIEEILDNRTQSLYTESGMMSIEYRMWPDFLRIIYSDDKADFPFADARSNLQSGMGHKIVLRSADRITELRDETKKIRYTLDFLFDQDFDPVEFLK